MIICDKCNNTKLSSEFHIKDSVTGRLDATCKLCRNLQNRNSYYKNIEKRKASYIAKKEHHKYVRELRKEKTREVRLKRVFGISLDTG